MRLCTLFSPRCAAVLGTAQAGRGAVVILMKCKPHFECQPMVRSRKARPSPSGCLYALGGICLMASSGPSVSFISEGFTTSFWYWRRKVNKPAVPRQMSQPASQDLLLPAPGPCFLGGPAGGRLSPREAGRRGSCIAWWKSVLSFNWKPALPCPNRQVVACRGQHRPTGSVHRLHSAAPSRLPLCLCGRG